jgi:hypothetical protein
MMQNLVGIVAREEMVRALDGLKTVATRAKCHRLRPPEYNPGWHTAIDLKHRSPFQAITRAADERKESRGGLSR